MRRSHIQPAIAAIFLLLATTPAFALSSGLTRSIAASMPQISELEISAVGEMVVLKGSTADPEAVNEIERRLRAMGHERIVNGIELVRQPSDAAISSAVERDLYLAGILLDTSIVVRTNEGIVVISGNPAKRQLVETAVRIAGRVQGVREVRSELTVETEPIP